MALSDLQAFIVQRLQQVDNTLDLTPGSPYDVQVIQPILRRIGTDPFTVDIGLFIQTLLNQQFPDMPTKEGDAITDLLIKAGIVLWNPIVREISRISNAQSFRDPTILTLDDAESLGANLFAPRITGNFARGTVRIYFAQPQTVSVTPANFITSKEGLHFFPTETQSIRVEEMLLNLEGTLYYFDVNVIAEAAGDQYNIAADDVVTIANVASAIRLTNKVRFRAGTPDEDAVTYVGRIGQDLTERSLVTQRGVTAKITADFPEVTRLNVVGFNDVPMQRDVLTGGGLGPILASGTAMFALPDGENAVTSRRVATAEPGVDFTALIGPVGELETAYFVTIASAYQPGSLPLVRDLRVRRVVDPQTLDLYDQVIVYSAAGIIWTLRKETLTLSGIPGGILYPDTPQGTIAVPNNQVHIGGATDVFVRGTAFDSATLELTSIVDDRPLLSGVAMSFLTTTTVSLDDLTLGTNYSVGDATYQALADAAAQNLSVQIMDPPNAGSYRILAVAQTPGFSPVLTINPALTVVVGSFRWRLSASIFIDLAEPKETKIAGADLRTVQGIDIVDTTSGVDFSDYGVGPGDILRVMTGRLVMGDYTVKQVLSPFFTKLQVDRPLPATVTGVKYAVFRPNAAGGLELPFARISSVDLLDTSGQPVGAIVPYAKPVDVQSGGFANSARGVKLDVTDGRLGIVSQALPAGANVDTETLDIAWTGTSFTVTFAGANPLSVSSIVTQINTAAFFATGGAISRLAVEMDGGSHFGLLPVGEETQITSGTAMLALFGFNDKPITARDINSTEAYNFGGWAALRPALDPIFDVADVVDGLQIGFYGGLLVPNTPFNSAQYDPLRTSHDFNPELRRHIQVGARSLGMARLYFLDPTSFEIDPNTTFTLTNADGSVLNFFPDPTNNYQRIPALPSGTKPTDGHTGGILPAFVFESLSTDFIAKGIQPGDLLQIDYVPLIGGLSLPDPVVGLHAQVLTLSINNGPDKNIIFIHDSNSIPANAVTRQGVVDQINRITGQVIASLTASNELQFNPDALVTIRPSGSANTLLGFSTVVDQNNASLDEGTYTIVAVAQYQVEVASTTPFPTGGANYPTQQFKVFRAGLQRIVSTDMAKNVGSAGLYYFDAQLISEGTGDQYNIVADQQMTVTGYRSDGYYLTTVDPNLTFSPVEKPELHLSRSILEVGVSDDPSNATQLAGQNLQVNYDRSTLVGNVDNYIRSDTERVINESPLGRHLIPYFVRFAMTYTGGSNTDVLIPDIQSYIQGLYPTDALTVSDLEHLAQVRGARSVTNPIDLIAVIHNFDRSVTVERSQDRLNTGTLAAFIPDVLLVTRNIA